MRRFSLLLTAILVTACGGSTEPTTVYGTYNLRTINGAKPPVVIYSANGVSFSVTSSALTLRQDGTFSWTRNEHSVGGPNGPNDFAETEDGTFTQSGNDLVLTYSTLRVYTYPVTWSGNHLTLTDTPQQPALAGYINATYVFSR